MSHAKTVAEVKAAFRARGIEPLFEVYTNNATELPYRCPCGRTDSIKWTHFVSSGDPRCWFCARNIKGTESEKREKYLYLLETRGLKPVMPFTAPKNREKFKAICSCGDVVELHANLVWAVKDGCKYQCKKCQSKKAALPGDKVREDFKSKGATPLFSENEYRNKNQSLPFRCECGAEDSIHYYRLKRMAKLVCSPCRYKSKRLTVEEARKRFEDKGFIPLFTTYRTGRELLPYKCGKCGKILKASVYDMADPKIYKTRKCLDCQSSQRRIDFEHVISFFTSLGLIPLFKKEDYKSKHSPLRVLCSCGKEILRTYSNTAKVKVSGLCKDCQIKYTIRRGENHGMYLKHPLIGKKVKGFVHDLWALEIRRLFKESYPSWSGGSGGLQAHHLASKNKNPLDRVYVGNGVLLWKSMHMSFHKEFGFGGNTREQFEFWCNKNAFGFDLDRKNLDSSYFIRKQMLEFDLKNICANLGIEVEETEFSGVFLLKKGTIELPFQFIQGKGVSKLESDRIGGKFPYILRVFEQDFLHPYRRPLFLNNFPGLFEPKNLPESSVVSEIPREIAKDFFSKYSWSPIKKAGRYFGVFVEGLLCGVVSSKKLSRRLGAYRIIQSARVPEYFFSRLEKLVVSYIRDSLKAERIVVDLGPFLDAMEIDQTYLSLGCRGHRKSEVFYAKNSFVIHSLRFFRGKDYAKKLKYFDQTLSREENLVFNGYRRIVVDKRVFVWGMSLEKRILQKTIPSELTPTISSVTNSLESEVIPVERSYEEKDFLIKSLFEKYRKQGFPYLCFDKVEKKALFEELLNSPKNLLENKGIRQNTSGLALAWSYFPHHLEVKCGGYRTPMDVFQNDTLFLSFLKKIVDAGGNITEARIRNSLKTYVGAQCVSNFRPTAAREIYDLYAGDGVVYDPSAGFGGRLLGALASTKVKKYIGTDPSTKTYQGLLKIKEDFGGEKEIELHNLGSEVLELPPESVDLCFTSPPYFDREKYSDELTQSFIKYPDRESWINGYLHDTLERCWGCLKKSGFLIINIEDVQSFKNLKDKFLNLSKTLNFEFVDYLHYSMSGMNGSGVKHEPIYVMRKRI